MTLQLRLDTEQTVASAPQAALHPGGRRADLDALKAALTVLVVFHHSALTYGAVGGWFYRELPPSGSAGSLLLTLFATVNQSFFMGLFFLIAGLFTPPALQRKGGWLFMRDRLLKFGLPLLVFGWLLGPLTVAMVRGHTVSGSIDFLMLLWRGGHFIPGPMWFALTLLVFSGVAALWHGLGARRKPAPTQAKLDAAGLRAFPTHRQLLVAALVCGAVAFGLRLRWPVDVSVWHMLPGYFASYVLLFGVGCLAAKHRWLDDLPAPTVRRWRHIAAWVLPTFPVLALLLGAAVAGLQHSPQGGWNVPSLVYAMWEPLVAWGIILTLLHRFKHQLAKPGPVWRAWSRRAYAIYVIHPVVLVGVALAWRSVPWPALLKFTLTGTVACVLCFWIAGGLLRVPGLRRVL